MGCQVSQFLDVRRMVVRREELGARANMGTVPAVSPGTKGNRGTVPVFARGFLFTPHPNQPVKLHNRSHVQEDSIILPITT